MLFYVFYVRARLRQDESKDPASPCARAGARAAFMGLFFSVTILAFDWISGLEPEWYSDMFGVYLFAGALISGIAAMVLGVLSLMRCGRLPESPDQTRLQPRLAWLGLHGVLRLHRFAQYMLIWYANLPEEVIWFKHRIEARGSQSPCCCRASLLHVRSFCLIGL